jgi:hypothetical protein
VNNESSGYYTPPASPLSPTPETPVNNESSSYTPTPTPEPTPAPVDDAMAAKAALYGMSLDEYKSYVDYYGEEYLDNYYAGAYDETPVNNDSSSYTPPVNNETSDYTAPPKSVAEQYGMTEEEYAAYEEEYYRQYYEDYYKNYYDTTPVNNDSSDYTNYEPPVNNESSGYAQEQADYDAQVAEYNRYLEEQMKNT